MSQQTYEMTMVPKLYYKNRGMEDKPICAIDGANLEKLDEFKETIGPQGVASGFYYEGSLTICPSCGHVHYILDHADFITGPVTVGWEDEKA